MFIDDVLWDPDDPAPSVLLEALMGSKRNETFGTRAIATPLLLIVGLLALHFVASDWAAIPRLINSTLAAIQ